MKEISVQKGLVKSFDFIVKKGLTQGTGKFIIIDELLKNGEMNITDLSKKVGQSYRNTQRHVDALMEKEVLLLSKYTNGKKYMKLNPKFIKEMEKVIQS